MIHLFTTKFSTYAIGYIPDSSSGNNSSNSSGYDTSSGSGSAVLSAKTGDTGIALYVGMTLMSLTGSGVLLGKRKEF